MQRLCPQPPSPFALPRRSAWHTFPAYLQSPNLFDADMATYIRRQLQARGIRIVTAAALEEVLGGEKAEGIRTSVGVFEGDLVVLAIGVRPATGFLAESGLEMNRGAIVVDDRQRTGTKGTAPVAMTSLS